MLSAVMGLVFELLTRSLRLVVLVSKYFASVLFFRPPEEQPTKTIQTTCPSTNDEGQCSHREFRDIPGPRSFPIIGSQWLYFWPGPYTLEKLHLSNEDKFLKYGPIVKEHFLWNFPIIHLFDKKDIEEVLKYPSKYPIRPELEVQGFYRRSRPDRYASVGIVSSQGSEWHHLRSNLTSQLLGSAMSSYTVEQLCNVSDELITKLRNVRDARHDVHGFETLMYRFALEAILGIVMNHRMGTLKDRVPPSAENMFAVKERLFALCNESMYGLPWWKYVPTKCYTEFAKCEETLYDGFAELLREFGETPERASSPVLDQILGAESVDYRDKITILYDLVLAGIQTTANQTIFLLHHILHNPEVKARVYEELASVLPSDSGEVWTPQLIKQLTYLQACVTEVLRLSPVTPNVARCLEIPFVFQGYHIPAGSVVICQTWVANLQEENYVNAREFIPERWLSSKKVSPFFAAPFGVGKRMCPGKRIAEYEMVVLAAKLLTHFDMSFKEPVEQIHNFIISPKGPITVTLKDR